MQKKIIKYAGFWHRLLAHNIDLLLILIIYYLIAFLIPPSNFDYLLMGGIYILYYSLFEYSTWAATPGKKWTKIKVVHYFENHLSFFQVFIRNTSKIVSLLLFLGGFLLIAFNKKNRGLHDYIGKTIVIFEYN